MFLNLLLSLLPGMLSFLYFYFKSSVELLLFKLYLFSVIMVIPALIVEKLFISIFNLSNNLFSTIILSFIIIATVEEYFKYLALKQGINYVVLKKLTFKEIFNYAFIVGLGFAQGENMLYALFLDWRAMLLRILITPLLHTIFVVVIGFYLLKAIKQEQPYLLYTGFLIAVFLHGLYDFLLLR